MYSELYKDSQRETIRPRISNRGKGIVNQGSEDIRWIGKSKQHQALSEDDIISEAITTVDPLILVFKLCLYHSTLPNKSYNAIMILGHKMRQNKSKKIHAN